MLAFWESLEKVTRLNDWLLALAAIFALIAALCGGLAWFTGKRVSALQDASQQVANNSRDEKINEAQQVANAAQSAQKEAEQKLRNADERVKQLEDQKRPRVLTESQRQSLSSFLATQPAGSVTINASINANDARNYADAIASVLKAKGWNVKVSNAMFGGSDTSGLWIVVKDAASAPPSAGVLQHALNTSGINTRATIDPDASPNEFSLCIGSKD